MKNALGFATLLLAACGGTETGSGPGGPLPAHKAVLEMYVMSQCPYGVQVMNAITPVKKQLGDALELRIDYIGQGEKGSFTSMHGPSEVRGDIAGLCVNAKAPDRFLDVLTCMNEEMKKVDTNWRECAQQNGVDVGAVETCVNGEEGQDLLAASFARAKERKATGSPTMFLDGEKYAGQRKSQDFLRAICKTYGDDAPAVCRDIPEPPKVTALFLSDARCKECDLKPIEPKLKGAVAGLSATYLDYGTPEGQALFAEVQGHDASFKFLPAVLLKTDELDKDADGKKQIEKFLKPIGPYSSLKVGGRFDPTAEICDNTTDDDADGLSDCADDQCTKAMVCREAKPGKLDMFVMSQCPYGAKAMIAAAQVLPLFADGELDLDVHFIGQKQDGKLTSMHGQPEVDLDLVEICAADRYPSDGQFVKFLACVSKDYKAGEWQPCAAEAGMDVGVIDACAKGADGQRLLEASFDEARSLGISASPTFLVNNQRTFGAIAADKLQAEFCADNKGLKGCEAVVQASVAAPQGGGGGKPANDPSCGG